MKDYFEEKFVKKAKKGDAEAFGFLYDKYLDAIYRFIYLKLDNKADAEDLTQQVFLKAWENIDSYEIKNFPFSSWLYRIAHNLVIDYYRANSNHPQVGLEMADKNENEDQNDFIEKKLQILSVKEALKKLPQIQQSIIIMKFIEEFSNKEIAQILGKSEGAIRVLQHRALKQLKKYLNESGNYSKN